MATTTSTSLINSSGITVGTDGKIKVSGLSSGIDSAALIEAAMTAKRLPAVSLENKITANTSKITAMGELKTLSTNLSDQLNLLRSSTSYGADDVFKAKSATGSTAASATAASGYVPSGVDSLISASVSNSAVNGSYDVTIQQLAQAQQIRSDSFNSKTDDLNLSGSFELNGKTINVSNTDSLIDIRSTINASGAGVTATVVSASSTEHYLVLTSDKTGEDNVIDFGANTTFANSLGLTAAGVAKNELREAKNAILDVNGITGIERQSNSVDDLIEGVTLVLTKAEPDTVITLDISTDLSSVKTTISDFVDAYNELKNYLIDQRTTSDRNDDGEIDDDEYGDLYGEAILRQIESQLSDMVNTQISGNPDGYKSLSQLGITMDEDYNLVIDDTTLDSALMTDVDSVRKLFALDFESSDGRVQIASRDTSTAAGTYYLSVTGTDASGNVTGASISATPGGPSIGTVSVSGAVISVTDGAAKGLKLLYTGGTNGGAVNDIEITVSRGLADLSYDYMNNLTKTSGTLETEITSWTEQNSDFQDRVDVIDARLEIYQAMLENKYTLMETALAQLENLKKTIEAYADSMNSN